MTFSSQRVDRVGQGRRGERRLTKGGDRMGSAEVRGDKRWRFPGCFLQVSHFTAVFFSGVTSPGHVQRRHG